MLQQVPLLPATLRELTLHGGAAAWQPLTTVSAPVQPLRVHHMTQLKRLVLIGSAYRCLDASGTPDGTAAVDAAQPLLPASLRTLALQGCSDAADALRVLRCAQLRPPPGAALSLHTDDATQELQWPVYLDDSPRPPPAEGDRGARLPAGFTALRLCIPRLSLKVRYDLGSVPEAPPDVAELLCRLLTNAPRSYSQMRVFMHGPGGIILGVSGELIRETAYHTAPAVPEGDVERRLTSAQALATRIGRCACQLGLRADTATIDGERCVVMSRSVARRSSVGPWAT